MSSSRQPIILDGSKPIDFASVASFSAPKMHASKSRVVNVNHKSSRSSLTISTPLMLTWGAQEGKDTEGNFTNKWSLSLQFPSADYETPETKVFFENMQRLFDLAVDTACTYSKEWFGKESSRDTVEDKFNKILKYPKIKGTAELDMSRAPTMSIKLPCYNGVWKSEIYDESLNPVFIAGSANNLAPSPIECLPKMAHAICLFEVGGVWIANKAVSMTFNLKQAIVQSPAQITPGVCLLGIASADANKLKTQTPAAAGYDDPMDTDGAAAAAAAGGDASTTVVEDSDDDGDNAMDDTPAPAPAPPAPVVVAPPAPAPAAAAPAKVVKKIVRKAT